MKITIAVPTYKRAAILDTFAYLPSAKFYVHEFEVEEYREKNRGINVEPIPDELRGNIANVRNFILDREVDSNDAFLMLDDDVKHVSYHENMERNKLTEAGVYEMLERHSILAKEWGFPLWGINVNSDRQCYREYTPFSTLSYVSGSFSVFLKGFELRYDGRFPLKEDYDMTLQVANKYRGLLRVNKYYYMKLGAEQEGGCATYRNHEREAAQLKALQRKWGRRIVQADINTRNHMMTKGRMKPDFNPVIRVPIAGV